MGAERELAVAVTAATAAGRILTANLGTLKRSDLRLKGESDWVTTVDKASERAIIRILTRAFPGHTIVAEESAPEAAPGSCQWFIDPLDGTSNYIHQFPFFCVSIALMRQKRLEVGVIWDPCRKELFTARRGFGARLNGRPIRVSAHPVLKEAMLATGFPFRARAVFPLYLESFRRLFLRTGTIRRAGSAALDLAYTACGRVDGFWEMALSPWDMAAGALIIQEAGGKVSDFFGGDRFLLSGHIAAANPKIQRQLVGVLAPVFRGKLG